MTSILLKQKISKRSLTLNKSFILSLAFHSFLILGITFTTFYQIPVLKESPIINVKLANSSEDIFGNENFNQDLLTTDSKGRGEKQIKSNIIVMNSDLITTLSIKSMVSFHTAKKLDATIAAALFETEVPYGVLRYNEIGKLINIEEKPKIKNLVAAGVYILNKNIINLLKRNQSLDMPKLIDEAIKKN